MWKCPDCNYIMDNQDVMCKNCGHKRPKEVTPPQPSSSLATILKWLSIITIIADIFISALTENALFIIPGVSTSLIFYVLGEIIQKLHNIENKLNMD